MTDHSQLDATIACLGLEYSAEFVPQSRSRNAKEQNASLNWRVTIKNAGRTLTTDYMQGIGHLPDQFSRYLDSLKVGPVARRRIERNVAETGKTGRLMASLDTWHSAKPLPAPLLRDVLYCLVLDSSVIDCATFEEWASEYGYDTDSREAEKTYSACLATALQMRAIVGNENLNRLREAFQDY